MSPKDAKLLVIDIFNYAVSEKFPVELITYKTEIPFSYYFKKDNLSTSVSDLKYVSIN